MSNFVQGLVYARAPYEDDRFKVLLALADWADDEGGHLNPSLIKLARKSRVGYRNTIKVLQKLETEKIKGESILRIVRHKKKGMANDYFINIPLLESLPYYWPPSLKDYLDEKNRVNSVHPRNPEGSVEKGDKKGERGGKDRVNRRVNPKGEPGSPHTSCNHDVMDHAQHDLSVNHDQEDGINFPVENFPEKEFTPSLFPPVEDVSELVNFAGARQLPIGGRYVRDETDPGGWSAFEIEGTFRELSGRELHTWEKRDLETMKAFYFSTQLTIYLMERIKNKASEPPGTLRYYRVSLERLWKDCCFAVREVRHFAQEKGLTKEQTFWLLNEEVLREIAKWEMHLSRS